MEKRCFSPDGKYPYDAGSSIIWVGSVFKLYDIYADMHAEVSMFLTKDRLAIMDAPPSSTARSWMMLWGILSLMSSKLLIMVSSFRAHKAMFTLLIIGIEPPKSISGFTSSHTVAYSGVAARRGLVGTKKTHD